MINSKVEKIAAGLSVLAGAFALFVFIYSNFIYQKPLPNDAQELAALEKESKKLSTPDLFEMKKMIITLNSDRAKLRYIEMKIFIVPYKASDLGIFETKQEIMADAIISVTSQMQADELNTVSGKLILESRLKKAMNKVLGASLISDLHFATFIVQ